MCAKDVMMSERKPPPETIIRAKAIWDAGLASFERYIGSGWVPPDNVHPDAEIWSATLREIFGLFPGHAALIAWWDALTLEQRYDAFHESPLGLDAFVDAYNARVFGWLEGFSVQRAPQ